MRSHRSLVLVQLTLGLAFSTLAPGSPGSQSASHAPTPRGARVAQDGPRAKDCARALRDASDPSNCISASSEPVLGSLFPISEELYVQPGTGHVGIGTTFPFRDLEVVGEFAVSATPTQFVKAVMRPSGSEQFGVIETVSLEDAGFNSWVTNLLSTVSIDPMAGAIATVNETNFLTLLTTPVADTDAGYVSVLSSNVETAGINGSTGTVFGAAKSFVQPHPVDPTKEIQYVSLEGPEHGVYFRGTTELVGGEALIAVPESFRHVARDEGLTVHLTPLGPSGGLYVAAKSRAGITVRENPGGSGNARFDYLVMGQRSALPEHVAIQDNVHFSPEPGTRVEPGRLPGAYRDLMIRNGTLTADGTVNEAMATGLGWRQAEGVWSGGNRASAPIARD
jgi:hypothetical protein